jgi:long-chain acyl-CoA synthetase
MEVNRLFDLLPRYASTFKPKDDVLAGKLDGAWKKYDIQAYIRNAEAVANALIHLGIKPGDNVATIMNNRPEWNFLDMGILMAGAVHVPIYPTITESDYEYILKHAGTPVVVVGGPDIYRKISGAVGKVEAIKKVYSIDPVDGVEGFSEFIALGEANTYREEMRERMDAVGSDDVATIVYTSGTTGNPKGVMLSHSNLISNFIAVSYIPTFGEEGKALSFLPLCHVYERMLVYLYQYLGISVYYAENLATVGDNVREVKPDMMSAVPRFLEKVYDRILMKGRKLKGIKRMIFFWAVSIAEHYDERGHNSWYFRIRHKIADTLVLSKWRAALGGNFKIIVSGSAALQPRLVKVYRAAGLPVYEGYGLTETSPVVAVTSTDPNGIKAGTVGPPLRGVEVKIADDGEILARGPNIMRGYYKEPELTAEVIDTDGWFHTGDVGKFEPEGQLRITGRKKEIFKTSLGKYIAPELIENKLKSSSFIDNAMVVGEHQRFAAALIVPDFAHLKSWCHIKEIPYTTDAEMVRIERIRRRFIKEVDRFNKELSSAEQVRKIELLDHEWSVNSGELTPTLKLKRNVVTARYQELIQKIFGNDSK